MAYDGYKHTAATCLRYALEKLDTEQGFAAAVDEAQTCGNFTGETVAKLLFATDTAVAWKALMQLADDLIEAAIDHEYYGTPGIAKGSYNDIARKSVSFSLTLAQQTAVAEKIAERMARAGVLA